MGKRSVSGVRKKRMTTMDIAIFVTLTLNVAMQGKHNMLLKINIRKQLNITRITSKQNFPINQAGTSTSVAQPRSSSAAGPSTSIATCGKTVGCINYGEASLETEIYWLAKMASSNYTLRSSDHVGDLFSVMFWDSKIAANFSLSHTSSSYIIGEGLLLHFTRVIIGDLVESQLPFCVHFDETSTVQVKKQMDLTLRYWSPTHNEVWSMFYTSLFFGHAEGVIVALKMYERMQNDGIPVGKMVQLVWDGPNVNKTIFKINELTQQDYPESKGLIDLGSCTIHTVHNAFGKCIEQYGTEIDLLCKDLYALFQHTATRHDDYVSILVLQEVLYWRGWMNYIHLLSVHLLDLVDLLVGWLGVLEILKFVHQQHLIAHELPEIDL